MEIKEDSELYQKIRDLMDEEDLVGIEYIEEDNKLVFYAKEAE